MSHFESIDLVPEDPILSIPPLYRADTRPFKINLGIGAYHDANGKPYVLQTVRKAERKLAEIELDKEYQPIDGTTPFHEATATLLFGTDLAKQLGKRLYIAQTLGASGALRIGGELLTQENARRLFLSNPSWSNHRTILERAGFRVSFFPYYDTETGEIDFEAMRSAIQHMPPGSVLLLQGSCHNPCGADPTAQQWIEISQLVKKLDLIPFFDLAYQGLGRGLAEDAFAVRLFAQEGHELLVANSYSKNFGLYGERIGALSIISRHESTTPPIRSQVKKLIRSNYSTPPLHGGRIITTILSDENLKAEWSSEVESMCLRIREMRELFHEKMEKVGLGRVTTHIPHQNGFFGFCGLTTSEVMHLRQEYAIYMPEDGRLNLAGLTQTNIDPVVHALSQIFQNR